MTIVHSYLNTFFIFPLSLASSPSHTPSFCKQTQIPGYGEKWLLPDSSSLYLYSFLLDFSTQVYKNLPPVITNKNDRWWTVFLSGFTSIFIFYSFSEMSTLDYCYWKVSGTLSHHLHCSLVSFSYQLSKTGYDPLCLPILTSASQYLFTGLESVSWFN